MTDAPVHHRINEKLEHYWQDLRGGRAMPLESEVDIAALGGIWDYCFLVSVHDGRFAYSYFGSELIRAYGDDVTGKEITETLLYPHPQSLTETFDKVVRTAQPQVDDSEFTNSEGALIKYRSCVVPLGAFAMDGIAFLLGGMKWKAY